jgi:hypothetical protein
MSGHSGRPDKDDIITDPFGRRMSDLRVSVMDRCESMAEIRLQGARVGHMFRHACGVAPAKLEQVIKIVGRCPRGYPPGAYDALENPCARDNQMKLPTFRGDPNGRFAENKGGTSSSWVQTRQPRVAASSGRRPIKNQATVPAVTAPASAASTCRIQDALPRRRPTPV